MAQKHVLDSSIVKTVKRYGKYLRDERIPFSRLIVFGSQAKGLAKPWSDIDVCVVSSKFGKDRHTDHLLDFSIKKL